MTEWRPSKECWIQLAGVLFVLVAVAVLMVWHPLINNPSLKDQPFSDTDAFMRMVRVEQLLDTGKWFDNTFARVNPPTGDVSHWTRPVDVTIIGLSYFFRPFFDPDRALWIAGVLIAPVYVFLLCLEIRACSAVLGERRHWPIPALALLFAGAIQGYGQLGRPDHHILVALCVLMLYRSAYEILEDPKRLWPAIRGGIAAGIGSWVSIETVVVSIPLFAALGAIWLRGERGFVRSAAILSFAWALTCGAALIVDPQDVNDRFAIVYDRLSIVHVTIAGAAAIAFGLLSLARPHLASWPARLVAGAIVGATLIAGLYSLFPDILGGPMVKVDPKAVEIWLSKVSEVRPLKLKSLADLGKFVVFAGLATAAVIVWCIRLFRVARRSDETAASDLREALFFFVCMVGLLALSIYGLRFALHSAVIGTFALAGPYFRLRNTPPTWRYFPAPVVRILVSIAFIFGCTFTTAMVNKLDGMRTKPRLAYPDFIAKAPGGFLSCPVDKLGPVIDGLKGFDGPPIVLAHLDLGPGILYFSHADVIATPYHRNGAGIVKAWEIFAAPDMQNAATRLQKSNADLVVVCAVKNEWSYNRAKTDSFHTKLLKGEGFPFLEPIQLPKDVALRMKLFRVKKFRPAA